MACPSPMFDRQSLGKDWDATCSSGRADRGASALQKLTSECRRPGPSSVPNACEIARDFAMYPSPTPGTSSPSYALTVDGPAAAHNTASTPTAGPSYMGQNEATRKACAGLRIEVEPPDFPSYGTTAPSEPTLESSLNSIQLEDSGSGLGSSYDSHAHDRVFSQYSRPTTMSYTPPPQTHEPHAAQQIFARRPSQQHFDLLPRQDYSMRCPATSHPHSGRRIRTAASPAPFPPPNVASGRGYPQVTQAPLMVRIPPTPSSSHPEAGVYPQLDTRAANGPSCSPLPRSCPRYGQMLTQPQPYGSGYQVSPSPSPRHQQPHRPFSEVGGINAMAFAGTGGLSTPSNHIACPSPHVAAGTPTLHRKASGLSVHTDIPSNSLQLALSSLDDSYGNISPAPSPRGGFSPYDMETKRCSNAIKKLCSAGNITEVFVVLEEMLARGLIPDTKTIKIIMRVCVKKLTWRRAVQLLHYDGLPLDVVVYTMAINTCGKAGEWEQGLRVLREMDTDEAKMRGIAPNEVSYGTAISSCGKAGRWEIALTLLKEVKDRGLMLNDVCYGGAIDACGRAGKWQEALKLLHEMMLEGVPANEVCYNSAISACGKAGEWEKAVSLLREMRDRGLTPDELNYNSAISACGKAAQWAHAIRLLREMAVQGLTPDVVSYGAAIDACRKAGKYDRGLALLREMKDVGLIPNEVCYHSAVTACSEAGRWSEALFVLSEMVKQGLKPDAISYNAAVEACAKSGKWEALVVLLQETGRDPDATLIEAVFNNAVMSCSKYGNWELAATVLQEMEYRGETGPGSSALSPTSASYSVVIEACAKALSQGQAKGTQRQWDLILTKLERMREKGLLPDSTSYNAAVRACVSGPEVKYWKKAVTLLQEMAARAYIVDQATSSALMAACSRTDAAVAGHGGSANVAGASGGLTQGRTERDEALTILRDLLGGESGPTPTSLAGSIGQTRPAAGLNKVLSDSMAAPLISRCGDIPARANLAISIPPGETEESISHQRAAAIVSPPAGLHRQAPTPSVLSDFSTEAQHVPSFSAPASPPGNAHGPIGSPRNASRCNSTSNFLPFVRSSAPQLSLDLESLRKLSDMGILQAGETGPQSHGGSNSVAQLSAGHSQMISLNGRSTDRNLSQRAASPISPSFEETRSRSP